jgi:hypothetical protein
MIEVGSFVRYRASDDEPPVPALVQTVWEDGTGYELYVFHFTSQSHVRSAHPSQVEEVGSNADQSTKIDELNEDLAALAARVTDLEEDNQMLRAELSSLSGDKQPGLPDDVPSPVVENAGVDSTPQDQPSSNEQTEEPELVGTGKGKTARRRSAWPNE